MTTSSGFSTIHARGERCQGGSCCKCGAEAISENGPKQAVIRLDSARAALDNRTGVPPIGRRVLACQIGRPVVPGIQGSRTVQSGAPDHSWCAREGGASGRAEGERPGVALAEVWGGERLLEAPTGAREIEPVLHQMSPCGVDDLRSDRPSSVNAVG